jgi:hypothetical protein
LSDIDKRRWLARPGIMHLSLLLLIAGIGAAIALHHLPRQLECRKVVGALSDLRSLGFAVESYQVKFGKLPPVVGDPLDVETLRAYVHPTFIKTLPTHDPWGQSYRWHRDSGASYSLSSRGKDGVAETTLPRYGATTDFNRDIYFSNGQFSIHPPGTPDSSDPCRSGEKFHY